MVLKVCTFKSTIYTSDTKSDFESIVSFNGIAAFAEDQESDGSETVVDSHDNSVAGIGNVLAIIEQAPRVTLGQGR